jgi:type IV pili sensor histidine kinase/response regulator
MLDRRLGGLGATVACLCLLAVAGCASTAKVAATVPWTDSTPQIDASTRLPSGFVPVVRQSRYTLVELTPQPDQVDLLQQPVEISIPTAFDVTVGDALRYVLQRSGYQLCENTDAALLYALPLPASHLHLGPLTLRQALYTLGGSAWTPVVDEADRRVCFDQAGQGLTQPEAQP